MYYIKNANVVLENGILWDGCIITDNDTIKAVGRDLPTPSGASVVDAKGLYVGPGFVDIHVHGGVGVLFYEENIDKPLRHFLEHGTTTILPTLYTTQTKKEMLDTFRRLPQLKARGGIYDIIGGVNMEGPYMNPLYGANPEGNIWGGEIRREDYIELLEQGRGIVKIWSIAPEREGVEGFLRDLRSIDKEAVVSFGHSSATPAEVRKLRKYGISLQTHSTNATWPPARRKGTRAVGPDEACMIETNVYAELICDSQAIHVAPETQQLLLQTKGIDKIVLITDCSVGCDTPPDDLKHVKDLMFDEKGRLNGSKLTMDAACKNIMTHTHSGIAEAFLMASRNPARVIGMDDTIGTIEEGKKANLVFTDSRFNIENVMLEGNLIK